MNTDAPTPNEATPPQPPAIPKTYDYFYKPKKSFFARVFASRWTLFVGAVVFPAFVILFELFTGACADMWFDPLKTGFHIALISLVPAANLVVWLIAMRGADVKSNRTLTWGVRLLGVSISVALLYTITFLPLIFIGGILLVLTFWVYGMGFLGLLPMSPLFALICASKMLSRLLGKAANVRALRVKRNFFGGALFVVAFLAVMFASEIPTYTGMHMYASEDSATRAKGLRRLRQYGNDALLHRAGVWKTGFFFNLDDLFMPANLSRDDARELYYRVTGEPWIDYSGGGPFAMRHSSTITWDDSQGDARVGGILQGLSLEDSFYEARHDAASGTAYAEWTMVFANTHWSDREARMRVALPPGAVVTRLTLWINDEPHEAAFGGRGQVRQAYENVVKRQRRDPVIVETCGPDHIRVQCFPVPSKGDMKIRFGFAIPLAVAESGEVATLHAPAIIERNFKMPFGFIDLPESRELAFDRRVAETCFASGVLANASEIVTQTATLEDAAEPSHVAIVLDGSSVMKKKTADIARALQTLPRGVETSLWIVDDSEPNPAPLLTFTDVNNAETQNALAEIFKTHRFRGGHNNTHTLLAALNQAEKKPNGIVVWLHGPQSAQSGPAESLATKAKRSRAKILSLQLVEGECKVCEKFDGALSVHSLSHSDGMRDTAGTLTHLFRTWTPGTKTWRFAYERLQPENTPDGEPGAREVYALWALSHTKKLLRSADPVKQQEAREFAAPRYIVTPVSSAVVLETQLQYKQAGLEQIDPAAAPIVPEPGSASLLMVGLLVIVGAAQTRRRKNA